MTVPDPAVVEAIDQIITAYALDREGFHAGWRCEYPDQYGPCNCRDEFTEDVLDTLEPLFRARESRAWDAGFGSGKQAEISAYWDRAPVSDANPYEGNQP